MIPLYKMELQDCEMFLSKWLKTNDLAHLDHFSIILSELGIGGLLETLEHILPPSSKKDLINAVREEDIFAVNDLITDAMGSEYILYKACDDSWQIIND